MIIQTRVGSSRQFRLPKEELLAEISLFIKSSKIHDDPTLILEEWEELLRKSILIEDYLARYNPYSDILFVDWIPNWSNIEWAAEIRNNDLASELWEAVASLTGEEFERFLGQVLSQVPWAKDVKVTGKGGDGGIDFAGRFIENQSGLELLLYGQAKHWADKIGSESLRTFVGSTHLKSRGRTSVGVYVATGGFTENAIETARNSQTKILLYDMPALVELMIRNEIGIAKVIARGRKIDNGFWDDLQG